MFLLRPEKGAVVCRVDASQLGPFGRVIRGLHHETLHFTGLTI